MKNKFLIIIIAFFMIFVIPISVFAKYTKETNSVEIIKINKADNIKPTINGRNTDYEEPEDLKTDVKLDYSDNIGVGSAKYWFNPNEKTFNR